MASPAYFSWANGGEFSVCLRTSCLCLIIHRSGKSSISNVVFHKLPPSETLYLETTTKIKKESMQYVLLLSWNRERRQHTD